ncbi:MAG TPA: NUDIX hydrolase [Candidatus Limnocylindria bacterium]|nr:NUDIX hydrolase [Candidatus Limnocylindria bacterium]
MTPTSGRRAPAVVGGIVRDGDLVLLVRQQGPNDAAPFWSAPGGQVESGETPLGALVRELREETGIALDEARPIFSVVLDDEGLEYWCAFYEATAWHGSIAVDDPDGKVVEARFLSLDDAIAALEAAPYAAMRDPELAWLRGQCALGRVFRYPRP